MGKVAFVFPGQGSQVVGMGKAVHDEHAGAQAVFAAADATLGEALSTLCFAGPAEDLKLTANTQPALLTVSIALCQALGEEPDVVAGHSLGEYTANVVAGALSFENALRLVRTRGRYMQEAVPVGQGAMAAVMGGDPRAIEHALQTVAGIVEPANYNSPGQIVIAGEAHAVDAARAALLALGCKVIAIPVSAPFHSSLMRSAEERLKPHLDDTSFGTPRCPVYVNVDAQPIADSALLRDALVRQVSRAVRWQESVLRMVQDGVTLCVEIGPGKVLSGLIKRIAPSVRLVNVQSPADFETARAAIRAARD